VVLPPESLRTAQQTGKFDLPRQAQVSIFGVGDYSFSPWKIAISGMYKSLRFVKVGPFQAQPVVFDDTTNFIPCPSETAATLLLSLLESDESTDVL